MWVVNLDSTGLALKKHSPYEPFLKIAMMKLIESGQVNRLKLEYESNNICNPILIEEGTPLSYQKLILLFIIMGVGIVFAFIVLLYERMKNICRPKKKCNILQIATIEPKSKEMATQTRNILV